jgi:hypothetical protein
LICPGDSRDQIAAEIAAVLIWLVRLSDELSIDIAAAVQAKISANALRCPAGQVRGDGLNYERYWAAPSSRGRRQVAFQKL